MIHLFTQMKHEEVKPYSQQGTKHDQVEAMFDNIAPTYDRLNHTMAWSIDRWWRRRAIKRVVEMSSTALQPIVLDIATGTGDLAIDAAALMHPAHIDATDISEGMMEVGRQKVRNAGLDTIINFRRDDVMQLSAADGTYDIITSAYGLRNFPDLRRSFSEMHRVLKQGGQACLIELATPRFFPMRQLFWLYSHTIMPAMGWLFSRDIKAYRYLVNTIEAFPQAEKVDAMLREAGFSDVIHKRMTFGICTYFIATK